MTGMAKETFNQHPSHQAAYYSIMSGIYACLASVLGKLSTDPRTFTYFQKTFIILSGGSANSIDFDDAISPKVASAIRIGLFATMFLVNGLMWTNYTKALDSSINSIRVVVLNNAVNMLTTAAFGFFLFGEAFNLLWWLGASFVVSGTVVISRADRKQRVSPTEESEPLKQKEQ